MTLDELVTRTRERLAARQHHVHPGVRIENREGKRLRIRGKFPCDQLERRRIGDVPALAWRRHVACDTARFGDASAVISVGGKRRRCKEERGQH